MRSGRIEGYGEDEKEEIKEKTLGVLKEIGISEKKYPVILADWHRMVELDYVHVIISAVEKHITKTGWHSQGSDRRAFNRETKRLNKYDRKTSPNELKKFVLSYDVSDPEIMELLEDYNHYFEKKKHRRPAVWKALQSRT